MSADKRSVATDALETLGMTIDDNQARDAIHLAVEPVIANEAMSAGEDVGFVSPGVASKHAVKKLGIVDPFLKGVVKKGERFWLVVYPRQISSLRHVWEHPDFPDSGETSEFTNKVDLTAEPNLDEHTQWVLEFANDLGIDYKTVMEGADGYVQHADYLNLGGILEGEYVPKEFWYHYKHIRGLDPHEDLANEDNFFSCSC